MFNFDEIVDRTKTPCEKWNKYKGQDVIPAWVADMDFKVAGTDKGITALQMDIKIKGVTFEIMKDALERARKARLFILDKITSAISAPTRLTIDSRASERRPTDPVRR